jgi:hypothetical protein
MTTVTLLGASSGAVVGPTVTGNNKIGVGYYFGRNTISTASYALHTGFNGIITIQGTLVEIPTESDWVPIASSTLDCTATPLVADGTTLKNIKGNFTWFRAVVTNYTAGAISSVTISY